MNMYECESYCEALMVNCRGYIMTSEDSYHIQSIDNQLTGRHFIFRDSDHVEQNFTCGKTHLLSSISL